MAHMKKPKDLRALTLADLIPDTYVWDNHNKCPALIEGVWEGGMKILPLNPEVLPMVVAVPSAAPDGSLDIPYQYLPKPNPAVAAHAAYLGAKFNHVSKVAANKAKALEDHARYFDEKVKPRCT